MSRQLPRLTDDLAQPIEHRPFWVRLAEIVPSWVLILAVWIAVYFLTILFMKGFFG
mgnify:CR=1 FL=1